MLKISFPFSEIGHTLNVSSQDVWNILTETTRWPEWGPSIIAVDCKDRYIRKRTRGRVKVYFGIWVPFVITRFEDQTYWSWDIWGIRTTGHRIEPVDESSCNIFFEVPTVAAPYLFICWITIKRIKDIFQHAR
jgi:hypothetical protein